MNRIDELIKKLCPNGVEYKKASEIKIESFWLMPSTPTYIAEGVPYITSKNIKNGKINFENVNYISEKDYLSISSNRTIRKNDLLITMIGTIGETAFVEEDIKFYGQNMYLIRLNEKVINRKFFNYYLTSEKIKNSLVSRKNTSSQGYIKAGSIENLLLPVPPLEAQCEIVHILDELTLKIEELNKKLKNELMIRQKQYKYYKEKIICKDIDIEWVPLLSVANTYTGLTYKPSDVSSNGILVLRSSNIQNNKLCFEDNVFVSIDNIPERVIVKENDILVCVRNGSKDLIGKAAIITKQNKKMAFGAFMTILRATNDINSRYLLHVWQSSLIQDMIHNDSGMPINQITKNMLETMKIPLPSHENQEKIANILDKFDAVFNDFFEKINNEIIYQEKKYKYYMNKLLSFKEVEKDGKV